MGWAESPSSRRAWIEILFGGWDSALTTSPSSRRAWIEIALCSAKKSTSRVALLAEGVDRNRFPLLRYRHERVALLAEGVDRNQTSPGCGILTSVALLAEGVDRNLLGGRAFQVGQDTSPSSRRAWIEISLQPALPPRSWSPSSRRAWIEMYTPTRVAARPHGRPPRGGRG